MTYHGSLVAGVSQKFSDTSKLSILVAFDYYESSPIMSEDRGFANLQHSHLSPNYPDAPNVVPGPRSTGSSPINSVHQRQSLPRHPSLGMTRKGRESLEKKR
jgi:hypothetical protein